MLHDEVAHLAVTVNQTVQLEIIVIFSERVYQRLGNLQPAKEERKLDGEEERVEHVQSGPGLRHWDPVGRLVSLLALGVDPLNRPRFKQLIWCPL